MVPSTLLGAGFGRWPMATAADAEENSTALVILSEDAPRGERPGVGREQGASESKAPCGLDLSPGLGAPLAQLLKRPEVTIEKLAGVLRDLLPDFFSRASVNDELP